MQDSITHEALEALRIVIEAAEPMRLKEQADCLLGTKHRNPIQKAITKLEALRTGQLILAQLSDWIETDCPSCQGRNISCPDGCGRDPETGELNGTRLQPNGDEVEAVARAICETLDAQFERFAPEVLEHLDTTPTYWQDVATAAIAALDAVRKARENGDG